MRSGHRRSNAQRLMDADKVVIHHVERNGVSVVLDLLGEGVGQPSETAHVHPDRKVLAFHVGRRGLTRRPKLLMGAARPAGTTFRSPSETAGDRNMPVLISRRD